MAVKIGSMYCPTCAKEVAADVPRANHILHFLLTLLTCGLWLPVWFLCALLPGKKRCRQCGSTSTANKIVPPTRKQLDYAALCGVDVRPNMDRKAVSKAIDDAFAADPKLKFKINARQKRKEKQAEETLDAMPAAEKRALKKWCNAAEECDHLLVVYRSGQDTVVDILECDDARVDADAGTIVVEFLAPRVDDVVAGWDGTKEVREKELCWDQPLTLSTNDILEARKVQIDEDQIKKYQSTIARKIKALSG